MINYPYIRLIRTYLTSLVKEELNIQQATSLEFRAGILDIDPYMEINNGRYHTLADIGRFNHGFRTGFFKKAIKNKLSFMVAGATAKYRYRIPFGKKFKMVSQIVYVDEKWVYYLTNFFLDDRLSASVLARTGTIKSGKLLKTKEASQYFRISVPTYDLPDWISLWISSDSKYPGF